MKIFKIQNLENLALLEPIGEYIAQDLFATMHDGDLKMHNIQ